MQDDPNPQFKGPSHVELIVSQTNCPTCGLSVSASTFVCPNDGTKLTGNLSGDAKLSDKYEFIGKLAEGGMGAVYKVRHKMLDKLFAIKILHANMNSDVGVKRFKREAQTTMELRHPGIVAVHDFGVSDHGQPFIVMELVTGRTLSQLIASQKAVPLSNVLTMFQQIAEAIAYAHKKGVVHRDIKPSNIIVDEGEDGELIPRLLDFGIARIPQTEGNTLTTTGEVFGSPGYMSPEQCSGQVPDERADVYSLGCTLYEMLTKRPVFQGANSLELVYKHTNEQPLSLTEASGGKLKFPDAVEDVVRTALAKNKEQRYASMTEFAEALSQANGDQKISRRRASPKKSGAGFSGLFSGWKLAATAVLAFGALAAAILMVLNQAAPSDYKVGQKLEVNWNGVWYPSEVVAIDGKKSKIHYLKYDRNTDEWVLPHQIHTIGKPTGGAKAVDINTVKAGDDLEVEWHGHWYKCDVLKVQNGQAFIHFSGYDHSDDQWVTPQLLRTPTIPDQPEPIK